MAYFSFNKSLDRRLFLKGSGAAVALPYLSAMTPAFAKEQSNTSPRRFLAINAGLGYHTEYFFPEKAGKDYKLSPYLEAVKNHKDQMTVISGVSHPDQNGNDGHASGMTLLTAARRPGLAGFKNTISIDQVMAAKLGSATRYPYLSFASNGNSLSWTANGVSIPADKQPVKIYKKLFVNGTDWEVQAQMKELVRGKSILDAISQPAAELNSKLGIQDKEKLDEYLTSIRELETRIQQNQGWIKKPKPTVQMEVKDTPDKLDVVANLDLYYQLIALAIQTDSSRVLTFNIGGSGEVPKIDGLTMDWHNLSHHGKDPKKLKELKLIELALFGCFNRFLDRLKTTKENGNNLLDRTAILLTSNLGNASSHNWSNLPLLVAGGNFKHGSYVAHDEKNNERLSNLFVQMGSYMGLELDRFGTSDSTTLKGLES